MPDSIAKVKSSPVRVGDVVEESVEHNGIKATLEEPKGGWLPPSAYRGFYARHVTANFALRYKDVNAKRLLMNAAYAKSELDFTYWFGRLAKVDRRMCE
ncbi:hypothetical protein PIB30_066645 [Stylosanthes scabra]|uniref:Uncharacterized protein n=1 Tax=Stylosanthes scabra TaxID=79078 RepID=A0ABU6QLV4_9FABA|nr:hypothetical protein [Stylosanthes scabra]